jgi:hypothetical protein
MPAGSSCAQLAAGPDSAAPNPPSVPNSTRMISMAAIPRGRYSRSSARIAGCSTKLSTKASTIGKTISAAT